MQEKQVQFAPLDRYPLTYTRSGIRRMVTRDELQYLADELVVAITDDGQHLIVGGLLCR
jgi:hypothetical protein